MARLWRHGDLPIRRLPRARQIGDPQIVRRKTFVLKAMTPDEAAYDMGVLDHDFYLFKDERTGSDAFVYRRSGGGFGFGLVPPVLSERPARYRLGQSDEPFLFYLDLVTSRGRVLYRRYDGHYGLIKAA